MSDDWADVNRSLTRRKAIKAGTGTVATALAGCSGNAQTSSSNTTEDSSAEDQGAEGNTGTGDQSQSDGSSQDTQDGSEESYNIDELADEYQSNRLNIDRVGALALSWVPSSITLFHGEEPFVGRPKEDVWPSLISGSSPRELYFDGKVERTARLDRDDVIVENTDHYDHSNQEFVIAGSFDQETVNFKIKRYDSFAGDQPDTVDNAVFEEFASDFDGDLDMSDPGQASFAHKDKTYDQIYRS